MVGKILKGAIIGGITAFIWVMISWMLLPWHQATMQGFKSESQVAAVIAQNIDEGGLYVLPYSASNEHSDEMMERAKHGPVMWAMISPDGINYGNAWHYIWSFITYFVAAGLISYLLCCTKMHCYWGKVCFITVIGIIIGWVSQVPDINWGGLPFSVAIVEFLDSVITWFLAGLLMARFVSTCCGHCHKDASPPAS